MDYKIINPKFYLSSFTKNITTPEWKHQPLAKPLELLGFEDIDLWILKETGLDGSYWRIGESYTGFKLYLSVFAETRSDAMENILADMRIKEINKDVLIQKIENNIEKWGLSPRYK